MEKIHITIVSDIACPWCAIGYARLQQAMKHLADTYEFSVQWHAFELNPNHSGEGEPILPALAKKYGASEEEMRANQAHMMVIAKELGLNFERIQERLTCNTFDAHRLVKWTGEQGLQTAMKQSLFNVYFGMAKNVSDHRVLLSCVESLGLDPVKAKQVLDSDEYAVVVREEEAAYRRAGITSVPAFIINNKYLISGAHEPDSLVQQFLEIGAQSQQA